ncbi:MAG: deaminase [Bryobacteraceae bacterium]
MSTGGCITFVELSPCAGCARAIIQAGLTEVVINHDRNAEYLSERYSDEHPSCVVHRGSGCRDRALNLKTCDYAATST